MRATVYPIPGRSVPDLSPIVQSWEPDESDQHAAHTAFNPSCAACAVATGAFRLTADPPPEPEPIAPEDPPDGGSLDSEEA